MKKTKLYFLQDLSCGSSKQVYSGHSGTGKKFRMYMSDYGKYAMNPSPYDKCIELQNKIEKDAKGTCTFKWNIVPMTEIDLSNFYEDNVNWNQGAFDKLKEEQLNLTN